MEGFKILGIGIHEYGRSLWNRRFDTKSFWVRCMKVNVIYAKFFQAAALHYGLADEVHVIPYEEDELVYPEIPVKNVIGSGLISIVFEGELEGVPVVIKTKRKNIEQRITATLASLESWILCFHRIVSCPIFLESYRDVSANFKQQLDFVSEYKNQVKFTELYQELPFLRIPKLYPNLCNENQLVMTKLEGVAIQDLTEEEKMQTVRWMAKMCVHGTMKCGYTHSDLHAGNLIFGRDFLGIIDYGFMLDLNETDKMIIYNIFKEFALDNLEEACAYTLKLTCPANALEELSIEGVQDITKFIIDIYRESLSQNKFFTVYDMIKMNKKLNHYGLTLSSTFYNSIVGLNTTDSVLQAMSINSMDFIICSTLEFLENESLEVVDGSGNKNGEDGNDEIGLICTVEEDVCTDSRNDK